MTQQGSHRASFRRRAVALAMGAVLVLVGAAGGSRPAQALDRDVKAVIVAGEYGMLGGTVLGLAALPFSQDARTIFIGTSLGLYLGIAVGLYYVYDRYDQNNPLRMRPGDRRTQGGLPVDGELRRLASARSVTGFEAMPDARAQPLRLDVPVLRF